MTFSTTVPGPATPEEMRELYPPKFTFAQLKGFIEYGYGRLEKNTYYYNSLTVL